MGLPDDEIVDYIQFLNGRKGTDRGLMNLGNYLAVMIWCFTSVT